MPTVIHSWVANDVTIWMLRIPDRDSALVVPSVALELEQLARAMGEELAKLAMKVKRLEDQAGTDRDQDKADTAYQEHLDDSYKTPVPGGRL